MLRPGCRSMDCSPVVLSSLNTGAKYTSPSGLGERQRLEHGLRLVLGLPELACRIRVGHDPGASLHHDPVPAHQRAADRDGGVEVRGTPADVPHRAGIGPAPLGLELVDDFHGAHLGRTRHGARGKAGLEHVERVIAVAQLPAHFAHEVLHVGVALDREQVRDMYAAEPRHPPHVVPPQIHEHHVLGALLLVGAQLVGERVVLLAGAAARAGAGDGPDGDLAPLHPDQHFRRAADQRDVVEREVKEIRSGIEGAEIAVQEQRVDGAADLLAARQHRLESVARGHVLEHTRHVALERVTRVARLGGDGRQAVPQGERQAMPAGAGPGGRSGPRSRPRPAILWPWSSARRRGCRPGSATLRAARCRGRYSGPSARRPRPIRGGTRTAAGRPSRMPRAVCRRPAPPRAARGRSRPARSGRGNRRGGRSSGAQWGTPGMDRRPVLAVLALGVLLRPAPVAAQAWNSDAALALARRAVLRRGGAVADSSLHDYKAQAHGFLFFLGAFGQGLADPPRLVKADQLELEVYWKAPASSKQRVIGWRDQTQLPTDINYHRDHLGIIQNNFGAAMRLGEGDEVRDVPHPLSPAGPDIYDFALGHTTTIMLPEREVRVVTRRVRPKDFGLPRIVGTLYLDAETADLVRMAFNFAPRSRTSSSRCARTTWSACARRWSRSPAGASSPVSRAADWACGACPTCCTRTGSRGSRLARGWWCAAGASGGSCAPARATGSRTTAPRAPSARWTGGGGARARGACVGRCAAS